ncbi:MAG: helix-turn-helix transcriptional regulator [Candidatus Kerfeldbacteria bacterium]|nr:helix-turn-helix transcriptional regulator [Candidatus Kerfeldbacteria bacterium]
MAETLMNHVRELRTQREQSQQELAEAIGVSRQTIVAIEKGNYIPSVALAMTLARQFRTTVEKLFYWKDIP